MIDTLANIKTALLISGTTDDAVLTRLMAAADGFIEDHCGRSFAGGTFVETHPAGSALLFLRNFPVGSVTSVKVDPYRQFGAETARDPSTFVVHADRGVVESLAGPFLRPSRLGLRDWPGAARVTYTAPADEVPAAVCEAFAQLVGHWYRQAKAAADQGHRNLVELTAGADTRVWPWGLAGGLRVPPGVLQLLAAHRAVPV